jgi:hypothetical protein
MDERGRAGPAGSETTPIVTPGPQITTAWRKSTTLYCGDNSCHQQCHCRRAQRGGPCIWSAEARVLCHRGTLRIYGTIFGSFQKLLYAILITSRKLRHYFDEYKITVIMDFPLADILHNQDAMGRISKWAVELGALSIDFKPRTTIKSQALVDFMAESRDGSRQARALDHVF